MNKKIDLQDQKTEESLKQTSKQSLLMFYFYCTIVKKNKQLYISKHNSERENQVCLLKIADCEKRRCLAVKHLRALLRGLFLQ